MLENSWVTSKLILAFRLTLSAYSKAESTRLYDTIISPEIITQSEVPSGSISNNMHSQDRPEMSPPPVEHPYIGASTKFGNNVIKLTGKVQNYTGDSSRDLDILSPKSVNIYPSGNKFYVNSLEGGKTVVYSLPELEKLAVINHRFNSSNSQLWTPASGLFKFRHYTEGVNNFVGKPVESAFSH